MKMPHTLFMGARIQSMFPNHHLYKSVGYKDALAKKRLNLCFLIGVWVMMLFSSAAFAGDEVLLTVTGNISRSNQADKKNLRVFFSRSDQIAGDYDTYKNHMDARK